MEKEQKCKKNFGVGDGKSGRSCNKFASPGSEGVHRDKLLTNLLSTPQKSHLELEAMKIMKMSPCKVLFVAMLCSVLLCCHTSSAGPARQLASLAARASKIPRSIRAPFRNSEMMTARGFGKRRVPIGANVGGSGGSGTAVVKHVADETPWGYEKREAGKLIEELVADGVDTMQMAGAGEQESFPMDWFASEMTTNPALARTILQRFVDTNRDGILTTSELISSPVAAASDSNDLF